MIKMAGGRYKKNTLLCTWKLPLMGKLLGKERLPVVARGPGSAGMRHCSMLDGCQSASQQCLFLPGCLFLPWWASGRKKHHFDRHLPPSPLGGKGTVVGLMGFWHLPTLVEGGRNCQNRLLWQFFPPGLERGKSELQVGGFQDRKSLPRVLKSLVPGLKLLFKRTGKAYISGWKDM